MTVTGMLATCDSESLGLSALIFSCVRNVPNTQVQGRTPEYMSISELILNGYGFIAPGQTSIWYAKVK